MNQKRNKFYVYGLICPIDNVIKYIGASINPEKRLKAHCTETFNKRKHQWISHLKQNDLLPILFIFKSFDSMDDCSKYELEKVKEHPNLLNGRIHLPYPKRESSSGYSSRQILHYNLSSDVIILLQKLKIKKQNKLSFVIEEAVRDLAKKEKIKP